MQSTIKATLIALSATLLFSGSALAGANDSFKNIDLLTGTKQLGNNAGFNTTRTIPVVVGTIVQWVLGLVGI
ncbi:MAG: hypothetical protein HY459_03990, partial [Parcubacteria group bacterium]|nr:hypothetical protein [Parcubacteria group bacterium]